MQTKAFLDVLNRGPALQTAWYGWVIQGIKKGEIETREGFGRLRNTPNAIAIIALVELLGRFRKPAEIHIQTNSRHLAGMIENGYVERWAKDGWILNTGKEIKNRAFWEDAWKNMQQHQIRIEFVNHHEYSGWIKDEANRLNDKRLDEEYLEFLDKEWKSMEGFMEEIIGGLSKCA